MISAGEAPFVIRARAKPGEPQRGLVSFAGLTAPCALGRGGIKRLKSEGDGATPAGAFRLLSVFYRPDRGARPQTLLPLMALRPDLGWCDDPTDRNYNRPVRLPYPASHEVLWRGDRLYDIVVVLDINIRPRRRGAGSALFFHIAKPDFPPTEGCVAVAPETMRRVLEMAGGNAVMVVG
ncbi:L,D-peptidoglycan transpeptidase YkuD (ErfK/YbiS/YcfS/YnhG family) [Rhodobium orientis]|uniref:L,D-TPase catalytic domain-containing protein n=1 Tax=Rhodobium orientis TaxID=34017 RepID=A0A327JK71_9HYPH|nr:L,D-transpeptidase family protein [Rhodobium orientis]MBB4305204.1 L,D-peptidoglycan transpeptidase YkuD (ErfK/YbiS/YcfS/YnhG family) [Rhodobium orientis]MBK5948693.1 hypothetical protein [Rhodobium orientis]RAI26687.1 hypothetical protein CH339_13145 [Rhodobium orientis]